MRDELAAPCRWCGYNGVGYWQTQTHGVLCPWHNVGGAREQEERLVTVPAPSPLSQGGPSELEWRTKLRTEQEMHRAWRKRAEEAERELAQLSAKDASGNAGAVEESNAREGGAANSGGGPAASGRSGEGSPPTNNSSVDGGPSERAVEAALRAVPVGYVNVGGYGASEWLTPQQVVEKVLFAAYAVDFPSGLPAGGPRLPVWRCETCGFTWECRVPADTKCPNTKGTDAHQTKWRQMYPAVPGPEGVRRFSDVNFARCTASDGFGHPLDSWSIAEWTNAAAGEMGEACNLAKKLLRHRDKVAGNKKAEDQDVESLKRRCAEELADVVIYADLAMQALGYDLEETVRFVFNRKSKELGSPYRAEVGPLTSRLSQRSGE